MPGKIGISHATPLHRMDAMRLYLSASVPNRVCFCFRSATRTVFLAGT
jgi:hypothetical protein